VWVCHGTTSSSVVAEGEIDLLTADRFQLAIEEAVRVSSTVEIDLRDTTFMASVGLHALLAAQMVHARTVVLIDPSPAVVRLLELAEVADRFPVRHGQAAAVASMQ
jgi:anti-anti-sigma factor